jgi:hypothetical protein
MSTGTPKPNPNYKEVTVLSEQEEHVTANCMASGWKLVGRPALAEPGYVRLTFEKI